RFDQICSGCYFSIKKKNGEKKLYPMIGVLYYEKGVTISIIFDFVPGWCDALKNEKLPSAGEYFSKPEKHNWGIQVSLNKDLQEFDNLDSNEQKELLTNFFIDVMKAFSKYL
ncbi:MAG: hypothetical protein AAF518_22260, partial [Spirochaetota bacterium]